MFFVFNKLELELEIKVVYSHTPCTTYTWPQGYHCRILCAVFASCVKMMVSCVWTLSSESFDSESKNRVYLEIGGVDHGKVEAVIADNENILVRLFSAWFPIIFVDLEIF